MKPFSARRMAALVIAMLVAVPAVGAGTAEARKRKLPRPTPTVIKKALTETWDTEFEHSTGGPGTITLQFKSIARGKTRRTFCGFERCVGTPVKAVFVQTVRYTTGGVDVSQITQLALFYRDDFGWKYRPKGADVKLISRT
jgi:hypothetical protein